MRPSACAAVCLIVMASGMCLAQGQTIVPKAKTPLWNGKDFTEWKLYLRDPNADVAKVWSVRDGVIYCTGSPTGFMRTETDYADYKLHVEWRWVVDVEAEAASQKAGKPPGRRNSGVLVHMSLPDQVWPKSIECQLMDQNAGDFFVIGGTDFKEHKAGAPGRRVPKQGQTSEKPLGEWNSYDITCRGNTIEVLVNGELKNKATETSVNSGKICLQSEGAPIEFRNVYIEPVE